MKLVCSESYFLTTNTKLFRLNLVDNTSGIDTALSPGKYLVFKLSDVDNSSQYRCYTLVSVSDEQCYDIIVENKGTASVSSRMTELCLIGKEIEVVDVGGDITFDTIKNSNHLLMIAGGIGITLPLSLIREYYRYYGEKHTGHTLTLVLSVNELAAIPYLNELIDLYRRCSWFNLHIHVTRSPLYRVDELIRYGRIDLRKINFSYEPDRVVICGSIQFAAVMEESIRLIFPMAKVETESFTSSMALELEEEKTEEQSDMVISVGNLSRPVRVNKKKTVLENLILHQVPIRSMCRSGICGSCKFRLNSGEVKSEPDFCLSATERDNGIRLACCSYPSSDIASIEII
ncbi:2Fe-2S iron-sulfur cluster-binding protein [Pectobacterium cacticida]|uniref:2Fe-2S iron-sulfur cluster-binding protein n=1 Tax=Pectobacterium cacticida TaxID=69221 RepID=UPI0039868BEE